MTKQELVDMLMTTDPLFVPCELEKLGIYSWERDFIFVWKDIQELYKTLQK